MHVEAKGELERCSVRNPPPQRADWVVQRGATQTGGPDSAPGCCTIAIGTRNLCGRKHDALSESRMREIRLSSDDGDWKRSMAWLRAAKKARNGIGYSRPVSDDERRVYDIHRPFTGGWQLRVNQRPLGGIYATLGLGPLADATSHCDPLFYGGYKGVPADCPNHIDLGLYVK